MIKFIVTTPPGLLRDVASVHGRSTEDMTGFSVVEIMSMLLMAMYNHSFNMVYDLVEDNPLEKVCINMLLCLDDKLINEYRDCIVRSVDEIKYYSDMVLTDMAYNRLLGFPIEQVICRGSFTEIYLNDKELTNGYPIRVKENV